MHPATSCRPLPCSTPWRNINSMQPSVAHEEMRRRLVPRNASSVIVTNSDSGTRRTSAQNSGTSSTAENMGEHFRVFPISNWTEMDVWQYIFLENIPMPSLYFTHEREVFNRDGQWLAALPCIKRKPTEEVVKKLVRCRTIGDITCTGLTESKATTVADIIDEIASTRVTERGGRADDKRSETAMEDRKKAGYF